MYCVNVLFQGYFIIKINNQHDEDLLLKNRCCGYSCNSGERSGHKNGITSREVNSQFYTHKNNFEMCCYIFHTLILWEVIITRVYFNLYILCIFKETACCNSLLNRVIKDERLALFLIYYTRLLLYSLFLVVISYFYCVYIF